MAAIWKFSLPLDHGDRHVVKMPNGARALTCQIQRGTPTLWALVEPTMPLVERRFLIVGTGFDFNDAGQRYIATVQLAGGDLVLHVFEDLTPGGSR